ncbi:cupin domain-containing protein [Aquimarina sp. AU474]|uniref:cupin domain-containing protein n=1 Tax=Aquimarina sp. AU474 TaxID=2108529 RepID=UPI000D68DAF4|nr:cupin domain-containing protein [Aquimarina sp. AU474]
MITASLIENITYKDNGPAISVLLQTKTSKEIRIVMKKGQLMKEHKAPFPIVVQVFEGAIDFGVSGTKKTLKKGDLIALDENVPHDLTCIENCIVRLSISHMDTADRVKNIVK